MDLTGKVILVTGASSGIGRAIAIECSKLGATCILTARSVERLQETLAAMHGEGHSIISADLTDSDAVTALVEQLPKLDGVSHSAGIGTTMLCGYASMDKIRVLFETNYFSIVNLQTLLLKKHKLNKGSSTVMMSSISKNTHTLMHSFYGSTKAALAHYARDLSVELKFRGMRFNAVCPGMIDTPLTSGDRGEDFTEEDKKHYLYGRYGKSEEVAHLVAYLLSDAAVWITGSEFTIDGGVSVR